MNSIREKRVKLGTTLLKGWLVDRSEVVTDVDYTLQVVSVGRLNTLVHQAQHCEVSFPWTEKLNHVLQSVFC